MPAGNPAARERDLGCRYARPKHSCRNSSFTIRRFRDSASSNNPIYLAERERVCRGMRMAGVPESDLSRGVPKDHVGTGLPPIVFGVDVPTLELQAEHSGNGRDGNGKVEADHSE